MTTPTIKEKIFPYLVILTGIMGCFGPCAFALSCAGIFFTPASEALGVGRGEFALYLTIMLVVTALIMPPLGRIIETKDLRAVLSGGVLCIGVPLIGMSFFNAVWQFYIAGAIMGIGLATELLLAVPTLVNRWFHKSVGFYIGLCMAFTGIGGVIFNLLGGYLIGLGPDGWRTGYLVFGILTLAMTLPCTIFCIRSYPSDIGLLPVGYDPETEGATKDAKIVVKGIPASRAMKTSSFFLLCLFAGVVNLCMHFYQYLPSYATSLTEYPAVVAAAAGLASMAMAGQAIGKILIGVINDRASIRIALVFAISAGIIGLAIMLLIPSSAIIILAGGLVFGLFYASGTVLVPLMVRSVFGSLEYSTIYSRITIAGSLCGAFAVTFWGFAVDIIGFGLTLATVIVCLFVLMVIGFIALNSSKKFADEL